MDLVECARLARCLHQFGDRFLQRVFLPAEIAYARSQKHPERALAARFAAKEATSKALGTGIGRHLHWHDMEIRRLPSGAPALHLSGTGRSYLETHGGGSILITLTHTPLTAAATALWIGAPTRNFSHA